MNRIEKALLIAETAHQNQTYDMFPYMYHIRMVKYFLEGIRCEEDIVVAGILHDTIEDSDLSYNDVKIIFDEDIAEIVYAVTDELGRNRKERKEKTYPKIKDNWKAVLVKIADRFANASHSKDHNKKMFEMYKKEHAGFIDALYNDNHPRVVIAAWNHLSQLFNNS